jgi:tetratricopeptide (TPR) repeat protein
VKKFVKLFCLAGLVLWPVFPAQADPKTYPVGDWMCPCPGGHKPKGSAPNCEEVCDGSKTSPIPKRDYEAERRAREAAAKEKATESLEKGLTAAGDGDLDAALRYYEEAKKTWPDIGTYKSRSGGYTTIDGLIAEVNREKRNRKLVADSKKSIGELAGRLQDATDSRGGASDSDLVLMDNKESPAPDKGRASKSAGQDDVAARASLKAVAEKQAQALTCAIGELQELAKGMGEEGAMLRAELNAFLENLRVELGKPCSGQPETQNIQVLSLSGLTKGAKRKEDHMEGNVLVTRDEKTCEVRFHVQHASSLKSASSSRSAGTSFNEGQSIIQMDKAGKILASETPSGVGKCLARLSVKRQ